MAEGRELGSFKAWLVCLVASLFFFYAFIQMAMFNSLGEPMMRDLHLQASGLAGLSSAYFYANVLFLFPAGMILDRFSTRRVILIAATAMAVTTFLMAMANELWQAEALRFIFGAGGAFCLLSNVRLASRWFPPQKLGFIIGVVVMLAMETASAEG